jgi:hypothetical protein
VLRVCSLSFSAFLPIQPASQRCIPSTGWLDARKLDCDGLSITGPRRHNNQRPSFGALLQQTSRSPAHTDVFVCLDTGSASPSRLKGWRVRKHSYPYPRCVGILRCSIPTLVHCRASCLLCLSGGGCVRRRGLFRRCTIAAARRAHRVEMNADAPYAPASCHRCCSCSINNVYAANERPLTRRHP